MGKMKTQLPAKFAQALRDLMPKYIQDGSLKPGDWCAVIVMDEGGGRVGMAVASAKDQEEARARRLQFQGFGEGRRDYIGSASLQVK